MVGFIQALLITLTLAPIVGRNACRIAPCLSSPTCTSHCRQRRVMDLEGSDVLRPLPLHLRVWAKSDESALEAMWTNRILARRGGMAHEGLWCDDELTSLEDKLQARLCAYCGGFVEDGEGGRAAVRRLNGVPAAIHER